MGMGRSVIDERLMQENRQDTLLKDIFRREIRQSRMELADVMQRLASVEQIQEQLVSLVIMRVQNAEIEAGMPEMAAATMNDATGPRIPDVIARPAEETMQMIQHQVGVANHHQRWSGVAAASAPASEPDTEEDDFGVDGKIPRFARDLPHARASLSPGAARKFASNAAPSRPKPLMRSLKDIYSYEDAQEARPAPPPPARKPDANSGDAGGIRDLAAAAWDQAGGDGSMTSSHGPPGAGVAVRGSPQAPTYSLLQGLGIETSGGGAGVDAGVDRFGREGAGGAEGGADTAVQASADDADHPPIKDDDPDSDDDTNTPTHVDGAIRGRGPGSGHGETRTMPGFVPPYGEGTMGELVTQVLRDAGEGGLTVTELIEACDRAGRKFKNAMAAQSGARSALIGNGNSKSQADSKAVFRCLSKEGRFVDQRWTVRFDKLDLTSLPPTPTGETVIVPKPGRRRKSSEARGPTSGSPLAPAAAVTELGRAEMNAERHYGPCEHGVKYRSWCKVCSGCPHGRRQRSQCKECGGGSICEHGRIRSTCKECGGSQICEHGRQRSQCKECGGASICEHGRVRSTCKECGGSQICEHGRVRSTCKECGGASICEHGRQRYGCKECGGSQICEHGRRRSTCKECGGSASICEPAATEVDWEEMQAEMNAEPWRD